MVNLFVALHEATKRCLCNQYVLGHISSLWCARMQWRIEHDVSITQMRPTEWLRTLLLLIMTARKCIKLAAIICAQCCAAPTLANMNHAPSLSVTKRQSICSRSDTV